jgi:hypothetical protein
MSKSRSKGTNQNANHHSDQLNSNRGTNGKNPANAHVNGNRGGQLNPNRKR